MCRTLLLGLGNDILTDDAIGLRVAGALRKRFVDQPNITVAESAEMGLTLLDLAVGYDGLVLVDAIQTHHAPPGFVHEFEGQDLMSIPASSPHFFGVAETLALGRELGLSVPSRVKVFAIEVLDPYTVSARMTPELELAVPAIIEQVYTRLLCVLVEAPTGRRLQGQDDGSEVQPVCDAKPGEVTEV